MDPAGKEDKCLHESFNVKPNFVVKGVQFHNKLKQKQDQEIWATLIARTKNKIKEIK